MAERIPSLLIWQNRCRLHSIAPAGVHFHVKMARVRLRLKCDGTRAETRFRLLAKRTSPFKSTRASLQSTTGSRGVRISGNNTGNTVFQGSVKSTGYPLHSPVSPSLSNTCVTVCRPSRAARLRERYCKIVIRVTHTAYAEW